MHRVDDHAGEAGGVDLALVEIEVPAAVLLREQLPLQAVGEPRHGAVKRLQLLVEKGAQTVELVGVAQILGADDLVIGLGENLVAEGLGVIEHRQVGAPRLGPARAFGRIDVAVEAVGAALLAILGALLARSVVVALRLGGELGALASLGILVLGVGRGGLGLVLLVARRSPRLFGRADRRD